MHHPSTMQHALMRHCTSTAARFHFRTAVVQGPVHRTLAMKYGYRYVCTHLLVSNKWRWQVYVCGMQECVCT